MGKVRTCLVSCCDQDDPIEIYISLLICPYLGSCIQLLLINGICVHIFCEYWMHWFLIFLPDYKLRTNPLPQPPLPPNAERMRYVLRNRREFFLVICIEYLSYFLTQCAAVMTQFLCTRVPPHQCPEHEYIKTGEFPHFQSVPKSNFGTDFRLV